MQGKFHREYHRLSLLRSGNKFSVSVILSLTVALSLIIVSQEISAQPFTGLRIIVHLFSEPYENANINLTDHDREYFDSKNVTIGLDGAKIVEFNVPNGVIDIGESYLVGAVTNSSSCGDVIGYNKPEYAPEYVDLYLVPCDLT